MIVLLNRVNPLGNPFRNYQKYILLFDSMKEFNIVVNYALKEKVVLILLVSRCVACRCNRPVAETVGRLLAWAVRLG